MSAITITANQIDANQTTGTVADADLLPRTNDVNYNNGKAIGKVDSDGQANSSILINSTGMAKKDNEKSHDKHKPKSSTGASSSDSGDGIARNGIAVNDGVATNDAALSRTLTRNSCGSINGHNIAKSWYARCNRWRSQSCDRRKSSSIRYSWNNTIVNNRPA